MTLTRDEQIKIDNFRAQYNSVLGRIRDANKQLESALSQTEKAKESLKRIQKSLEDRSKELVVLLSTAEYTERTINNKRVVLDKRENDLIIEREEFDERKNDELREIKERTLRASNFLKEMNDSIADRSKEVVDSLNIAVELREDIFSLTHQKELQNKSIQDLGAEIAILDHKNIRLIEDYNKQKNALTQTLKEIKEETKEEIEKVKRPTESLKIREKDIEIRERDFDILVVRLRKLYQELKPGVALNI